jgi:protein O-GlcNAc transferase
MADVQLRAAFSLHQRGLLDEAEAGYRSVLQQDPQNAGALQLLGALASQRRQYAEAIELFEQALRIRPGYADAHNNRGIALMELARPQEALASFDGALAVEPDYADAHNNRGLALQRLGRHEEALAAFDLALQCKPDFLIAHCNRGNALKRLRRFDAALASYDRALAIDPVHADTLYSRGNALKDLGRLADALESYDGALRVRPRFAEAHAYRGLVLQALGRFEDALRSYDTALGIEPHNASFHNNRGTTLTAQHELEEALACFDRALALDGGLVDAHRNRGLVLQELDRLEESAASLARAFALDPGYEYLRGVWLLSRMQLGQWQDHAAHIAELSRQIERGSKASPAFAAVALIGRPDLQRKTAEAWASHRCPAASALGPIPRRARRGRVRIGYYSADFHDHATMQLMAELFERHDRSHFELIAFSFGPDREDAMRQRIRLAFDRFIDVRGESDKAVAEMSRKLDIDIAVDLKGYTAGERAAIFAHRAAPLQAAYLGYPGTTGGAHMDYLVADATVVPPQSAPWYAEKIVYLPHSYQPNDARRRISDRAFTRAELGLPASGFVFCSFNGSYKITPEVFDIWMRLLQSVAGSVLWLLQDNPVAARNLRSEAVRRGVAAERLVFAPRLPLPEHLARHRAADLFLDTLPCNAHTTASDALWAGLPVLTRIGEAFAGRVAASLLNAVELPEMIVSTAQHYEELAVALATSPQMLRSIREKLQRNRLSAALFDAARLARHLEDGYRQMHERYQSGLAPEHIRIQA